MAGLGFRRRRQSAVVENIPLILAVDDLGHADLGYSSDDVSTPAIDALAATGLKLSCMYTWNWCAPSRGSLMVRLIRVDSLGSV